MRQPRAKLPVLLLLVAALGLGAVGWTFLVNNFLGIPLDISIGTPSDGQIPVYDVLLKKYKAGSAAGATILGQYAGGATSSVGTINVLAGLTGSIAVGTMTIGPDFGTAVNKVAQGNDSRFPPAPGTADNLIRDNGAAYVAFARGAASTVLAVSAGNVLGYSQITAAMVSAGAYGTSALTIAQGNDSRFPPTPSGAGKVPFDTGSGSYGAAAAGASTTVFHGGSTPSFSKVVVGDISSGAATVNQALLADGAGNSSFQTVSTNTTPTGFPETSTVQKFLVPLYIYPTLAGWTNYYATSPKTGIVIANPSNGPGGSANIDYTNGIAGMHTNGIQVVGYVHTRNSPGGTFRAIGTVEAEIDSWYSFYPVIDGIFLDEGDSTTGQTTYFNTLFAYIRAKSTRNLVVYNPGTNCPEVYAAADIIVTSENTYATYSGSYTVDDWTRKYASTKFCHIVHTCGAANYVAAINLTKQNRAGWVYVTDDPATYVVNPTYLTEAITQIGLVDGRFPFIFAGANATTDNATPTRAINFNAGANVTISTSVTAAGVRSVQISSSGGAPTAGTNITVSGTTVSVSPSTAAAGDLLVSLGTYFGILSKGSASTALTVSAANAVAWTTITNAMLAGSIAYSKLILTASIVAGDLASTTGSGSVVLATSPTLTGPTFNTSSATNAGGTTFTDNVSGTTSNGLLKIGQNGASGDVSFYGEGAAAKNLSITWSNTQTIALTADAVPVINTSNETIWIWTVSNTFRIDGAAGVNSIDTGTLSAATYYYVWIIYKKTNLGGAGTQACIVSLSSTAPTMPSGYAYKYRAGIVREAAATSTGMLKFQQYNKWFTYNFDETVVVASDGGRVLVGGTATVDTAQSLASRVPPISHIAKISILDVAIANGVNYTYIRPTGLGVDSLPLFGGPAASTNRTSFMGFVVTNSSQSIDYQVNNASVDSSSIGVSGFILDN